jgi:hypothetical protein
LMNPSSVRTWLTICVMAVSYSCCQLSRSHAVEGIPPRLCAHCRPTCVPSSARLCRSYSAPPRLWTLQAPTSWERT